MTPKDDCIVRSWKVSPLVEFGLDTFVDTTKPARFQLKYSTGEMAHGALMNRIELFAGIVVPHVSTLFQDAEAVFINQDLGSQP